MKFLIVGLGSMGKRRIRNLKEIGENDVYGFDIKNERREEAFKKYGISTYENLETALEEKMDVMIISTPPDFHMKYAKIALENNIHFFTEANVVYEGMEEIIKNLNKSEKVGIPSSTTRFNPIVTTIKNILEQNTIGKVLSFMHHTGQYLPDWHPWEDYRDFYVSNFDTGACREIVPFDIVWITDVFGEISSVFANKAKMTNLETDIDDLYNVLLEFKDGKIGNLTVDVISRFPYKQTKIFGSEGVIQADWLNRKVEFFTKNDGWKKIEISDGKVEENYLHGEGTYIDEMKNFLRIINGGTPNYTFEMDLKILKILEKIENSSDIGKRITVSTD